MGCLLYTLKFLSNVLTQSVGNRVGVQEPFLMRMAHGAPMHTSNRSRDGSKGLQSRFDRGLGIANHGMLSDEQIVRVCKRFYVALILSRLVQVTFVILSNESIIIYALEPFFNLQINR